MLFHNIRGHFFLAFRKKIFFVSKLLCNVKGLISFH